MFQNDFLNEFDCRQLKGALLCRNGNMKLNNLIALTCERVIVCERGLLTSATDGVKFEGTV